MTLGVESSKGEMATQADARIREWRRRFEKAPLARETVMQLKGRAQEIWRGTFDLLRKESPEYRNAVDDEFTAESKSHCGELLAAIVGIAAGKPFGPDPFEFVRRHAEWRARHQVPLVASLHAYRLAHKTYWSITREPLARHKKQKEALHALSTLSEFWIEWFEAVGAALEEAHAAEEARVYSQNTQTHVQLIEELLSGAEPATLETRQLLTLCGIRAGMKMSIAVARRLAGDDGLHVDAEVSTRSLARLLNQATPMSQFGKLVALRKGEVVLIAASSGPPTQAIARLLARSGFGRKTSVGAAIGISLDKDGIAYLPEALEEARVALEFAASGRVLVRFGEIDAAEYLARRADKVAIRLIPRWLRDSHRIGAEPDLIATIRAFADCSLNVKETARKLDVHTNTVYFRLNQIKHRAGVDPRTFSGLNALVTSLRLLDGTAGSGNGVGRPE